jgi:hypothetical protein
MTFMRFSSDNGFGAPEYAREVAELWSCRGVTTDKLLQLLLRESCSGCSRRPSDGHIEEPTTPLKDVGPSS